MQHIAHLTQLKEKLKTDEQFLEVIKNAGYQNPWFTESFVQQSIQAISEYMLNESALQQWFKQLSD
jgi:hypothetical protein